MQSLFWGELEEQHSFQVLVACAKFMLTVMLIKLEMHSLRSFLQRKIGLHKMKKIGLIVKIALRITQLFVGFWFRVLKKASNFPEISECSCDFFFQSSSEKYWASNIRKSLLKGLTQLWMFLLSLKLTWKIASMNPSLVKFCAVPSSHKTWFSEQRGSKGKNS